MSDKPFCVFLRGWGGRLFDNVGGADLLIRRIAALGVRVMDCSWSAPQPAISAIEQLSADAPVFLVTVSCGANAASYVEAAVRPRRVAYSARIQPSKLCQAFWMPRIPDNVAETLVIYGSCLKTLLFGCYKPDLVVPPNVPPGQSLYDGRSRVGNNGRTIVRYVFVNALHPADFDVKGVQDPILRDMRRIMG